MFWAVVFQHKVLADTQPLRIWLDMGDLTGFRCILLKSLDKCLNEFSDAHWNKMAVRTNDRKERGKIFTCTPDFIVERSSGTHFRNTRRCRCCLSGATVCDGVRAFNQTVMETLALRVPWPTACRLSYFPFLVCCHCEFSVVFMKEKKNLSCLITMLLMLRGRCLSNPSETAIKELACWINTLMTAQV